jgi:hypothetical protein
MSCRYGEDETINNNINSQTLQFVFELGTNSYILPLESVLPTKKIQNHIFPVVILEQKIMQHVDFQ